MRNRSHNHSHWGMMMFGAVLGAAATVIYYNQGRELSRIGSRMMDKSKEVINDTMSSMAPETDYYNMGKEQ